MFFSPIRQTDALNYDDFCSFFTATEEGQEIFNKTFADFKNISINNNQPKVNEQNEYNSFNFPVHIVK